MNADSLQFKIKLSIAMILDFGLCWAMETGCKFLFADLRPGELVTRGEARRLKRRSLEQIEAVRKIAEGKMDEVSTAVRDKIQKGQ